MYIGRILLVVPNLILGTIQTLRKQTGWVDDAKCLLLLTRWVGGSKEMPTYLSIICKNLFLTSSSSSPYFVVGVF